MWQRIKNLLDISHYSVRELKDKEFIQNVPIHIVHRPASIINAKDNDPFKDIADETTQQSLDDTTTRN